MGFFKTDTELIEPKKQTNNNTDKIKVKSLSGYDAIREKLEERNTLTVKQPIQPQKETSKYWVITNYN